MSDSNSNLISFSIFSPGLVLIIGIGCLLWAVIYLIVLKNSKKNKFVEIPAIGVCGNLAWEFVWGIAFFNSVASGLGYLFAWDIESGFS